MKQRFLQAALLLGMATSRIWAQYPPAPVDAASAASGGKIYASQCARCHGEDARGTVAGPDLLRSVPVMHDRRWMLYGKELAPLLKGTPNHDFKFDEKQLAQISQFLTGSLNGILRAGMKSEPADLLNGDAKAGEAYFNGAGGCAKCHSVTGDLAGVGKKYAPAALQQKYLFPGSGVAVKRKKQVKVALASGKTYTGDLIRIDDFSVQFRDQSGAYRSFNRTAGTKVTTTDPFAAHVELLDRYTDADIHNLTTYLETIK